VNKAQNDPAVEAVNLTKVFFQDSQPLVQAVRGVHLRIERGEIALICGPNGSGKTTLLSMLGCLLEPHAGTIKINGQDVTALSLRELAEFRLKRIGFIFQNFRLLDSLTVLENVEILLNLGGAKRPGSRERARSALEDMKMTHRALFYPRNLSGGEKQRVAIARAVVNDPDVILADEPTGSLDSAAGQAAVRLLCSAARERGKTVVIVSHDDRIRHFAGRVIFMEDGKIVREARP
jgi:putative ABC transport system ATP-binding protein